MVRMPATTTPFGSSNIELVLFMNAAYLVYKEDELGITGGAYRSSIRRHVES